MTDAELHKLFSAAVQRMDKRYDPLCYRSPATEVSLHMRVWAHERWRALFREWHTAKRDR